MTVVASAVTSVTASAGVKYSLFEQVDMGESIDLTHPVWVTAFGTIVGYAIIVAVLTVTVFVVPYLIFALL